MHLDCVFSILGDKCCIMLEEMLGAESKTRRLVDEYSRHPSTGVLRQRVLWSKASASQTLSAQSSSGVFTDVQRHNELVTLAATSWLLSRLYSRNNPEPYSCIRPALVLLKRLVSETHQHAWHQMSCCPRQASCATGKYELSREKIEFSQYMREEGYHIIPIKPEHQLVGSCQLLSAVTRVMMW